MRKRVSILFSSILLIAFVIVVSKISSAINARMVQTAIFNAELQHAVAKLSQKMKTQIAASEPQVSCEYDVPEEIKYDAQVIEVRKKLRVETNEKFRVKVFIKNTGNIPWFSNISNCSSSVVYLGTDNERDHESLLYSPEIIEIDNNWTDENRIGLDQLRVDPGQIASFTFWVKAFEDPDVVKEFMTPVVEGVTWIDNGMFSFDTIIGDPGEDPAVTNERMLLSWTSGSVMNLDLTAEKKISVDLSEQKMKIYLGGDLVREFTVSTGAPKTPTPVGNYEISLKQEVRIGAKPPHYVMPKFMMFRQGGYGIHALPSLSRKGGDVFWTEARSHIGRPVSHGCIRVLPEDANFVYDFAEVGTPVDVQR